MGLSIAFQATLLRPGANRALTLLNGEHATSSFSLPQLNTWAFDLRLRMLSTYGGYCLRLPSVNYDDAFCLLYGFRGDDPAAYEVYSVDNGTGGEVREVIGSVTDAVHHRIRMSYDGATYTCQLDEGAVRALQVANFYLKECPALAFVVRNGAQRPDIVVDYCRIMGNGLLLADFENNEVQGNPKNPGALGGELLLYASSGGARMEPTREAA